MTIDSRILDAQETLLREIEEAAKLQAIAAESAGATVRERWIEHGYDETAAEELARFVAAVASGAVVHVHPATYLRVLEHSAATGQAIGGISVRVSRSVPRGAFLAIAPAREELVWLGNVP